MKTYNRIPFYLRYFDVCIIPYVIGEATEAVNPIKFYEYIAANKPVVATPFLETSLFKQIARIVKNKEEFDMAISDYLKADDITTVKKRIEFARGNTWQKRAHKIKRHLMAILKERL